MKTYKKIWTELRDGVSDEWLYVHEVKVKPKPQFKGDKVFPVSTKEFIFIRIHDMVSCCGSDAMELFSGNLLFVNLNEVPLERKISAMRCCGFDEDAHFKAIDMAEMLLDSGIASVCGYSAGKVTEKNHYAGYGESHPAFRHVRAYLANEAKALMTKEGREAASNSVVNAIGQTLRQYNAGTTGLWERLRTIKENGGSPEETMILSMYQKAGNTLGAGPVPEDILS